MSDPAHSALHKWTERIISRLKRDSSYKLDRRIPLDDLFEILFIRGCSIVRGLLMGWRLGRSGGTLFLGRGDTLRHKKKVFVGRSDIIEDFVYIDALSQKGITLGNNVTIAKFTTMQCTGIIHELGVGIEIGDNSAVGAYSFLGGQGGIRIGQNVIMGPRPRFRLGKACVVDSSRLASWFIDVGIAVWSIGGT